MTVNGDYVQVDVIFSGHYILIYDIPILFVLGAGPKIGIPTLFLLSVNRGVSESCVSESWRTDKRCITALKCWLSGCLFSSCQSNDCLSSYPYPFNFTIN